MTISVLGCGPTGANWDGKGYCIGVNDCLKFGKEVNRLIVVNSNFEPDRMAIIQNSRPKDGLWSQLAFWALHPDYRLLQTRQITHAPRFDVIYHSITSPFIALSMAAYMGATRIIMHGVDFDNHPIVKDDTLSREVDTYLRYITYLRLRHIIVSLGTNYGAFKDRIR